jgi:hypothetical protein
VYFCCRRTSKPPDVPLQSPNMPLQCQGRHNMCHALADPASRNNSRVHACSTVNPESRAKSNKDTSGSTQPSTYVDSCAIVGCTAACVQAITDNTAADAVTRDRGNHRGAGREMDDAEGVSCQQPQVVACRGNRCSSQLHG